MTIHHANPQKDFSRYSNAIWKDERLTSPDRVVLLYLLSKPSDWKVIPKDIRRQTGYGRDLVNKTLGNLIKLGYAKKVTVRTETGRFGRPIYHIYEIPLTENQETAAISVFPASGKTTRGKSGHLLTTERNTKTECYKGNAGENSFLNKHTDPTWREGL